uniref:Bis(5'-nucleosyl)-tetraphosphatase, symmetrical n=1 Tax=Aceria tosichella TaxID=561515 RepID=A0A6G1S6P0_9ACAR
MSPFTSCLPKCSDRCSCSTLSAKHPMAKGENFITLSDEYIARFDEIVVVGDIHGCYDEFKELLNRVHSETPSKKPNKCLKILVGDLVNKGPDSKKVLKLCIEKYPDSILAVRGNHDAIVSALYKQHKTGEKQLEPKNKWIEKMKDRYITYLDLMPYSIKIPSLNCIIVHAGIDPSLEDPAVTTPLYTMTTMRNIVVLKDAKTGNTSYLCTKNEKEGAPWALFWPGPEHVYFGHDARRRLQDDHEFATGLDTGCVYGDRLSYKYIKGPRKGEICSIKAKKVYEAPKEDS